MTEKDVDIKWYEDPIVQFVVYMVVIISALVIVALDLFVWRKG